MAGPEMLWLEHSSPIFVLPIPGHGCSHIKQSLWRLDTSKAPAASCLSDQLHEPLSFPWQLATPTDWLLAGMQAPHTAVRHSRSAM